MSVSDSLVTGAHHPTATWCLSAQCWRSPARDVLGIGEHFANAAGVRSCCVPSRVVRGVRGADGRDRVGPGSMVVS